MDAIVAARGVLEAQGGVRVAYVFGSVARGESVASSDLDIAVVTDSTVSLDALTEDLERATGRDVDVVDAPSRVAAAHP